MTYHTEYCDHGIPHLVHDGKCDNCGCEMEPVFPALDHRKTNQFHGALAVNFEGGYGMFFYPISETIPDVVLCKQCANQLFAALPGLSGNW